MGKRTGRNSVCYLFSPLARCSVSSSWCYGLNLTIDANFRLKNKDRQLDRDVSLGDGWGHWVKEDPYKAYLEVNTDEPEVHLYLVQLKSSF